LFFSPEENKVRYGTAMWYYTKVKPPNDVLELQTIKHYKMKGFSV
jgi:hypothetical protein